MGAEQRQVRLGQRQLGRCCGEVRGQHVGVVGVHDGGLHRLPEQRVRMVHQIGVEGIVGGHEERERSRPCPARPACLLPQRGPRPGPAGEQHGVEAADVDAQLQGIGGGQAHQRALPERPLERSPFFGQITASVCRDRTVQRRRHHRQGAARCGGERLDACPRAREGHRLHAGADEVRQQVRCLARRASPHRGLAGAVRLRTGAGCGGCASRELGRLPEPEGHRLARRAVPLHRVDRHTDQAPGVGGRLAHGGRGEHECRLGAVAGRDSAQPAQQRGQVRPEDAAVHVALVDDDVAQGAQERRPPLVLGSREWWTRSGLVRTNWACSRIQRRSSWGVSPSYVAARSPGTAKAPSRATWSAASALVGDRYRAVAPRPDGARAPSTSAVSTGSRYPRLLPDAVPVDRTTWEPAWARSAASRWCDQSSPMPEPANAAYTAGSTHSGHAAVDAVRAGTSWTCSSRSARPPAARAASTEPGSNVPCRPGVHRW